MFSSTRKVLILSMATVGLGALTSNAFAETHWQKDHPRRTEVNHRLAHQNRRIHNDVKDGTLSRSQASKLHHEDHQVRQEERDMASQDHGHITKTDQRALNQQENGISGQIPPR